MAMLLSEARTIVADHLDDASNDRWSSSQLDNGLKYGLASCINEYIAGGGDRLDKVLATSTDANGVVDLSSVDPQKIKALAMVVGTRFYPIVECEYEERALNDGQIRSVQIRYVPSFVLPTGASTAIVSISGTAAKTFDSLEQWICARAALYCSVKDAEDRPELRRIEQEIRDTVLSYPTIPKTLAFPERPHWYSNWFNWSWKADEQKLQLSRKGFF